MKQNYMPESLYKQQTCENPTSFIGSAQIFTGIAQSWNPTEKYLYVKISDTVSGILPLDQISIEPLKFLDEEIPAQAKSILQKQICFYIDKVDSHGRLLLSRRKLQENVKASLVEGEIRFVQVKALHKSGVFVDLGCGLVSYIHFSEITICKFLSYSYAGIAVDAVIPAKVLAINPRIKLSYRQTFNCRIRERGDFVPGIVLEKVPAEDGYYVFISPNEAGIVDTPKGFRLYYGQQIKARIKNRTVIPCNNDCTRIHYKLVLN